MKRPAMHSLAVASDEALGTGQHLLRRAPSERQQQNSLSWYAALDEMGDSINERAGLSGSGTSDDQQRSIAVCRGRRLLWIQLGCEIARRWCRIETRSGGVDAQRL